MTPTAALVQTLGRLIVAAFTVLGTTYAEHTNVNPWAGAIIGLLVGWLITSPARHAGTENTP